MESSLRSPPEPTRPGVVERLPQVDHLTRAEEVLIPAHLPGTDPQSAEVLNSDNPCFERTGLFGRTF